MPLTTDNNRFRKDPAATRDYSVDWADSAIVLQGATLASVAVTATPVGLTVGATATSGSIGTVRLSGGTLGTTYEAAFAGTFSDGQIDVQRLLISIEEIPSGLA